MITQKQIMCIGQRRVVRGECGCSLFVKSNLYRGTERMRTASVQGAGGGGGGGAAALQAGSIPDSDIAIFL
jgi:hypothetical protein